MLLNKRVLALSIGLLLTMIASTQVSTISASTPRGDAAAAREMMATGRLDGPATQVAVVPIIVNAGTALLPTIMGALANLLSILFSPRALGQVLRRRWKVAVTATASLIIVAALAIPLLPAAPSSRAAARAGGPPATEIDWAKVAEDLIALQGLHAAGEAPAHELTASAEPVPVGLPAASPEGVRPAAATTPSGEGTASPAGLRPIWSFQPEDGMFLGTAAIVGTRVYVAANQTDLGGYTGLLASLDLETGRPIWQVTEAGQDTLLPFFSSPAVTADGKYLVIGQGLHQDRDASLLCFETATGKLHWAVKTPLHIESSPAIFGDIAVVGAGAVEGGDGRPTGDPGYVFAVRISDGTPLWKQPVNDPESSPAVDEGGVVYIGSGLNGKAVVALRSVSDEELQTQKLDRVIWRTPLAYPITAPVTISGDLVIVGGGNGDMVHSHNDPQGLVVALHRTTGEVVWQAKFEDSVLGRIAVHDGVLLAPLRTGEVAALAVADGHVLWRSRVSGNAPVLAGGAFGNDRAFAVSSDGYLVAFAAATGTMLEKVYLNDQRKPGSGLSISSPVIVGNRVIVGSETGGLRALLLGGRGGQ